MTTPLKSEIRPRRRFLNRWTVLLLGGITGWLIANRWLGTVGAVALRAGLAEVRYRLDTDGGTRGANQRLTRWQAASKHPGSMLEEIAAVSGITSLAEVRRLYARVGELPPPWQDMMAAALARRWIQLDPESALAKSLADPGPAGPWWGLIFAKEWAANMTDAELTGFASRLMSEMRGPWQDYLKKQGGNISREMENAAKMMGPERLWRIMRQYGAELPDGVYAGIITALAKARPGSDLTSYANQLSGSAREAALQAVKRSEERRRDEELIASADKDTATALLQNKELPGNKIANVLADGWGKREPDAAREWAMANLDGDRLSGFLFRQFIALREDQPMEALRTMQQLSLVDEGRFRNASSWVLAKIAPWGEDPAKLAELKDAGLPVAAAWLQQEALASAGKTQELLTALTDMPSAVTRFGSSSSLTNAVVRDWPQSRAWVEALPDETLERFSAPLLDSFMKTDPAAAASLLTRLPDPEPETVGKIAAAWAAEDPAAASRWAHTLSDSKTREKALKALGGTAEAD